MTPAAPVACVLLSLALMGCDAGDPSAADTAAAATTTAVAGEPGLREVSLVALERHDYATALKGFRSLADEGNAEAQWQLGEMYGNGNGVSKDLGEALRWVRRAAEHGHAEAQFTLGALASLTKDAEDIGWLRRAADQGDEHAIYLLAHTYATDDSAARDPIEALRWYRRLAEGDSDASVQAAHLAEAQFHLAEAYRSGEGVAADPSLAIGWYIRAADNDNKDAQLYLATAYSEGKVVAADDRESVRWLRRAAEQYSDEGQYLLGMRHATGDGVAQDPAEAMYWLRRSSAAGNKKATKRLPFAGGPRLDQVMKMEREEFGIQPVNQLHSGAMHGPTPTRIPDGQVITTKGLVELVTDERGRALIFDVLGGQEVLPGAFAAKTASSAGSFNDQTQDSFGKYLRRLTDGKKETPLVFYCQSTQCWLSYNASLRAIHLGYANVLWYRGGIHAWKTAGQPVWTATVGSHM